MTGAPNAIYGGIAAAAGVMIGATDVSPLPLTETTIAGAIVGVSLFWIRRSDKQAVAQHEGMQRRLDMMERQVAALIRGYGDRPLPAEYLDTLTNKETS